LAVAASVVASVRGALPYIYPVTDQRAGLVAVPYHAYYDVEVANAAKVSITDVRGYTEPQERLVLTYSYRGPMRLSNDGGASWQGTSVNTTVEDSFDLSIQGQYTIHACSSRDCVNETVYWATK
jgi:hypothetical protein